MSSEDNKPKPGSDAYDLEMAAKFRRQNETFEKVDSSHRVVTTPNGGVVRIRIDSSAGPNVVQAGVTQAGHRAMVDQAPAADVEQIRQIEREIARLKEDLAATTDELDPDTKQPIPLYQGHQRKARELQLAQLEGHTLPYQIAVAQAALEASAQLPSAEERLLAEKQHQQAIRQRAEEIVDEAEAAEQAERIAQQRRSARGGF